MKYNISYPFFPKEDIKNILLEFKEILAGRGLLTMGKHVKVFEFNFAKCVGAKYAVAVNSCTSALEISLCSLNIKEGDEVIVPVQTFIATGSCVLMTGAKVVFCNTDENFLLDFEDLKKKITRNTKAVIIVHFAGLIHPEIFEIKKFLRKRNIYLLEDAAHACGAKIGNYYAGSIGDLSCFSFFSTKIITTGEGGMIATNNKRFFEICSSMRNRGLDLNSAVERFSNLGSNRRMTEIQGILGCYQLKRIESFIKHRKAIAAIYLNELLPLAAKGIIRFQNYPDSIRHAYWRFVIFLKNAGINRELLGKKMMRVGVRIDWPYQPLLHAQPLFKARNNHSQQEFDVSETLANTHFCIPLHMGIKASDARFIAHKLKLFLKII